MPPPPTSREALQACLDAIGEHGSASKAAIALGINRGTLNSRVRMAKSLHMESKYKKPIKHSSGSGKRVLVIPDMHHPFGHPDTVPFLAAVKERFSPDKIVCLGDETDQHALSQHDPDPSGFSAGHEHLAALDALRQIYALFPVVSVCISNHGERIFKRAYKANIPKSFLKEYAEFMDCPKGWHWEPKFVIDDVIYEHGEGVSGQLGAMKKTISNGYKSTVIGHLHADAGILWTSCGDKQIFAMNCGCLIDAKSYAFAYGKHNARKPMIGCGIVDCGQPTFIAMQLDINGRWNGKL